MHAHEPIESAAAATQLLLQLVDLLGLFIDRTVEAHAGIADQCSGQALESPVAGAEIGIGNGPAWDSGSRQPGATSTPLARAGSRPARTREGYLILDFSPLFWKNTLGLNECVH